jgi:probable HAF family extracellular repeat protein
MGRFVPLLPWPRDNLSRHYERLPWSPVRRREPSSPLRLRTDGQRGFVRSADGAFTSFNAPGAGKTSEEGTAAFGINTAGVVMGPYTDSADVEHGYVRAADGTITDFDPTGSTQTEPWGINDAGDVVGYWTDTNTVVHGFLRTP